MNHHFLPALLLCQLLLQNVYVKAQVTKLEGSTIMFELPGTKWKLTNRVPDPRQAIFLYQRESMPGDDAIATIAFYIEEMHQDLSVGQYFAQKNKLLKATDIRLITFGTINRKMIGLDNANLGRAYANVDSFYIAAAINGSKGLLVLCSVKGSSFPKYDSEFRSFLRSLGYGKVSTQLNDAGKINTLIQSNPAADDSKSKAIVPEKKISMYAVIFP